MGDVQYMTWALRKGDPAILAVFDGPTRRTVKQLQTELDALPYQRLLVTLNSARGTYEEGLAFHKLLSSCRGWVRTYTDFAANGAAIIAMACIWADRFIAKDGTWFAQAPIVERVEDRTALVERLRSLTYEVAGVFSDNMAGNLEWWRSAMETGMFYDAVHAVDGGVVRAVSTLDEQKRLWVKAPTDRQPLAKAITEVLT